jgi:hypothetical protein
MDVQSRNVIPALGVVVRHGGYLESRSSNISFSGHLLVDDAKFDLIDSTISGVNPVFNSTYFPVKVFSSSPVMLFMSSNVTMIGSKVYNMYDNGTYNTVINAPYNNNYQFAKDDAKRQFVDYYLERDVNAAFGPQTTATVASQNALSMTMNDTKSVTVAPNQKLYTTGFDMGGLVFEAADVSNVILHISYLTDTSFPASGTHDAFYYTPQFGSATAIPALTVTPTYQVNDPSGTNVNVTKDFSLGQMSAQSLGKLTVNYTNSKNSNVYIDRIWLTIQMRLSTYRNITVGGSTNLIAADSYIPLNGINENNGTNSANGTYHKLVALDQSIANLYNLTVQNSVGGYSTTSVFMTKNSVKVISANGTSDSTGQDVKGLYAQGDGQLYDVTSGQTMNIVRYNLGEMTGSIKSLTVSFVYFTEAGYTPTNYIQYSINGSPAKNTNLRPLLNQTQTTIGPFDLYSNGVNSISKLKTLTLSFTNGGGATVHFDRMYLNIQMQPEVALYRWANLNVTDSQSVPVGNVGITSSISGSGSAAYYLSQTGTTSAPPQAILNYLGKTRSNFNRTGAFGIAQIPLLSDVLNSSNSMKGPFDYDLVFQFRDSDGLFVLAPGSGGISTNLAHFPNMVSNTDARALVFPTLSVGLPDLSIIPSRISVNPAVPLTNTTVTIIANVTNSGNDMGQSVVVSFYDVFNGSKTLIGNFSMPALKKGQTGAALMLWEHMLPGNHNITVAVDEKNTMPETSKANNQASLVIHVLNSPDLVATDLQFKLSSTGTRVTQVFLGDSVTLDATVMNTGESAATDFLVRFWLGSPKNGTQIGQVVVPAIASGTTVDVQMPWIASVAEGAGRNQSRTMSVEVNPFTNVTDTPIVETNYTNNIVASSLLVIDNRADLWFPGGVSVKSSEGNNTTEAIEGQMINITFRLANQGVKAATGAELDVYVIDADNFTTFLKKETVDLNSGASTLVSFPWIVNVTAGAYSLVVDVNSRNVIDESNMTNDIDSRMFTVDLPNPLISISVGAKTDFQPGDSIYVSGTITNSDGSFPLANQSVTIRLLDAGGLQVGSSIPSTTNAAGQYSGYVFIPTDRSGSHTVSVTLNSGAGYSATTPINVVEIFKPQSVPLWMFGLIAAIVFAVILVFSVYLYKYGLGKMVECGECGALIPESSKRCPRCSTEFETETAKCSECGTWIPARSKECPECGAKFMTEPVEEVSENDYTVSMRRQYEEYVNGFREQAKAALGKKYSEDKFMDWLKTEPAYLPFEAWVTKQEESRKVGSVSCPACGILNPKGATICSKCGTVFDKAPETVQVGEAVEPAKPFRKIVKRSSERKMIPKKVIKDAPDQPEQSSDPAAEEKKKE